MAPQSTTAGAAEAQSSKDVFIFEDDEQAQEQADIYVTDTYENRYGDERAILDGDTYDARTIIKFDWHTTHHDYDDTNKVWIVDADSLDELGERLREDGYTFDPEPQDEQEPENETFQAALDARCEGDTVRVAYEQKNGNGRSSFSGEIYVPDTSDTLYFRREDDLHAMWVELDSSGTPALYTTGSHAPFVGTVLGIEIEHPPAPEVPKHAVVSLEPGDETVTDYCSRCDEMTVHKVNGPDAREDQTCVECGGW